jgi:chaperone required for assembly of F1-ATPase
MRDIFEDMFRNEPRDPIEAARRAMKPPLRRRFYETVGATETADDGFALTLDGRPVRTPGHRPLIAPVRGLVEAIAAEWAAQVEFIEPARMPLTQLANSILDGVADGVGAVADEVAKYLACDLVFYRATVPDGLVARQAAAWDPLLDWARERFGARFVSVGGMAFAAQDAAALAAAAASIPTGANDRTVPWRLGALHSVTTLTGSALIALALMHGRLTADEAWTAAHVDEDWNMLEWGRDELALERRAFREAEMRAAATVLSLLRD